MNKFKITPTLIITLLFILFSPYQKNIIGILIVLFIHELGHIIIALIFKIEINRISLTGFGFIMDSSEASLFYKNIMFYFAGILFNLISLLFLNNELQYYAKILIIINIIPIFPLDGYQIIKTILSYFIPYKLTIKIVNILNVILLVFITIFLLPRFDYLCIINLCYLWFIEILNIKNQYIEYEKFLLKKYLYPNKFKIKKVKFINNRWNYLYKYHYAISNVGDKIVEETDILDYYYKKK